MLGQGGLGEGTVEEEGHHGDGGPRLGEFEFYREDPHGSRGLLFDWAPAEGRDQNKRLGGGQSEMMISARRVAASFNLGKGHVDYADYFLTVP